MKACLVSLALTFGLAGWLSAGPLDPAEIPAGARWLVHVDSDAARKSKAVDAVRQAWMGQERVRKHIEKVRDVVGLDPSRDLHSVTFCGSGFARGSTVVIVRAEVNLLRLAGYMKKLPEHGTESYRDHQLHRWTQGKGRKHEHTVTGAVGKPGVLVFGRNPERVKAVLDVLDGRAPKLADDSPLAAAVLPGTVFAARAIGLSRDDVPFKSPVVRLSQQLSVLGGEKDAQIFVRAKLVTNSEEVAGQVRDVIEGFRAMAKLGHEDDEETKKFFDSMDIGTEGREVTVGWRGPDTEALKLIVKEWMKRHKPKRKH